ncbi:cutinase family protein [Nocardia terpenica]|nr:cutinase family protein [Nocardia terpenica]
MLATAGSAAGQTPTGEVPPPSPKAAEIPCTPLHVLAFAGTGETGETADPTIDSGFLGEAVTRPLLQAAPGAVSRQMVPYADDFGLRGVPYAQSMTGGVAAGMRAIGDYAARCPASRFALVGFSQGAQVADEIARMIGTGAMNAPIRPYQVAAVSLFSSPIRQNQAAVFAGTQGQLSPAPPPGLAAPELSSLMLASPTPAPGAGIAPTISNTSGYGELTGRVASWCNGGDVACSTPADAPLARAVANIGGQVQFSGQDPLKTVGQLAAALGGSVLRTAASVINNDVSMQGGHLSIGSSGSTVLGRLAANTDPRTTTPQADNDIIRAVIKTGVMGFQAAVMVASKVLTPANIAELVTAGLANPVAALADLGAKLAGAALDLVPPATIDAGVRYAFGEITRDVTDNAGLVQMATDLRYWDSARQHTSYDKVPVDAAGQTPAGFTVAWLTVLAKALAAGSDASSSVAPTSVSGR